jgi:hypothetical protein
MSQLTSRISSLFSDKQPAPCTGQLKIVDIDQLGLRSPRFECQSVDDQSETAS